MENIVNPLKNLINFSGKSSPKEFWTFYVVLTFLIAPLSGFIKGYFRVDEPYSTITNVILGFLLLAIGFRRMNDAGFNKWLFLIPLVNLILALFPSKKE